MTMPIVKDKDYHRALVESLAAAQAEIERLRATLQAITDLCKTDPANPFLADDMDRLARAALEPKPLCEHQWYRPDWMTVEWEKCRVCGTARTALKDTTP